MIISHWLWILLSRYHKAECQYCYLGEGVPYRSQPYTSGDFSRQLAFRGDRCPQTSSLPHSIRIQILRRLPSAMVSLKAFEFIRMNKKKKNDRKLDLNFITVNLRQKKRTMQYHQSEVIRSVIPRVHTYVLLVLRNKIFDKESEHPLKPRIKLG